MRNEFNSLKTGQTRRDVMRQSKHKEFLARMAFNLALSGWEDKPETWGYEDHRAMYADRWNLSQYQHCEGDTRLAVCYDYEHCELVIALDECYLNAEYVLGCYLDEVLNA